MKECIRTAILRKECFLFLLITTALTCNLCGQTISLIPEALEANNVRIENALYKGKKAIHITGTKQGETEMAILKGVEFGNGKIEIELSGAPLPGRDSSFRGFIGVAFHVQQGDTLKYECFYLRPTNGRANDQLRRNHSTQYISAPYYPWQRLRKETPGVYESYSDMLPGEWTHIRIDVKNKTAKLYVNRAEQPCLIVNDLKNNNTAGLVALWIGPGTDGYFRALKLTKE